VHIKLNGEDKEIADGMTAQALIEMLGLENKRLAMEVNLEILPRSRFSEYQMQNGDQVEIVHAIGGGSSTVQD
jgi:sulfur carrier protein